MTNGGETPSRESSEALLNDVLALRHTVVDAAAPMLAEAAHSTALDPCLENLAHYLAIRRQDLRPLQRRLMCRGLSSLGHMESRVLPTLDAVIAALAAMAGRPSPRPAPTEDAFFAGEAQLATAADALFGASLAHRRTRIMVTLPSQAASDPDFVVSLAQRGMDVARINCAHDDAAAWRAMSDHVRRAGVLVGRRLTVLMDIAGPKIRTEDVLVPSDGRKLAPGDLFRLMAQGSPRSTGDVPFCAVVSLPEIVNRLSPGDRVRYNDGKLEGVVESVADGEALVRVRYAKSGGVKLKPEKGLNLPDTDLGLSPITTKDEGDLVTVIGCADMIGYSFVSRPDDIDLLEAALSRHEAGDRKLGLVAKIERPEAVANLPGLIARARGRRPFGVMIARGDLAAEIGFARVAEMQEEMLWICEAASVPAIWATQVLEDLVRTGIPSRGEMTDAAMAARAECVMLNKGPAVGIAVETLDRLLARMDTHMFKKSPMLRALKSW
jgi:pyruvate kinase